MDCKTKEMLKEVVDKCGILGSDLNDVILELEERETKRLQEKDLLIHNLAHSCHQKDLETIRLETLNEKLRCCGNCENEKFTGRVYDFTICNDCKKCSNWTIKKSLIEEVEE